jgi:mycofactocin system glycosyltransferase
VNSPSREDARRPTPIRPAPEAGSSPLPGSFGLTVDPATTAFDGGRVLMGGSPLRLLRLSQKAAAIVRRWEAGSAVGDRKNEQSLARRLVASGAFVPRPGAPMFGPDDVSVVIPVRDRPGQLQRLLHALKGLRCVVVDDGSTDVARTAEIARQAGADLVALERNGGPAAARNAGLARVDTPLVAFVDSDCLPEAGWLEPLLGHFNDPIVAAVAPRIAPAPVTPPSVLSRYEATRSSLDRGASAGVVRPMSRIPYVPSAALLVRRAVAGDVFFDPALRGGEDVDLVWRLADAGWDVRYEPRAVVHNDGPRGVGPWLRRRAFYGTTAGPLARRHPGSLSPLHTSAWTAGVWGLVAARKPLLASGVLVASVLVLARRLRGLVDRPARVATTIAGGGTARSALPALGGLTRAWAPIMALGLCWRRTRRSAALALLLPAVGDWATSHGDLDPVRYAALHVADDLAYGAGVWHSCLTERTLAPLLPRIAFKARVWSTSSLRSQLRGRPERPER